MGIKKAQNFILTHVSIFFFLRKLWKGDILRPVCFLHAVNISPIQGEQICFLSYHRENNFLPQDGSNSEKHQALKTLFFGSAESNPNSHGLICLLLAPEEWYLLKKI